MILVYLKDDSSHKEEILSTLKKYEPDYKVVGDNHLDQVITSIFSSEEKPKQSQEFEDFLFLDTMKPEAVQQFSKELIQKGIRLGRVAVRTENNVSWTLRTLMEEVEEEFQFFQLREKLYDVILHPDKDRLQKDAHYMHLMSETYALLENRTATKKDLEQAWSLLENEKLINTK